MANTWIRSRVFPRIESDLMEARHLSEDESFGYDLYRSPCAYEASNDEFSTDSIEEFEVCSKTFYGGCLEEPPPSDTAEFVELKIVFDFELWMRRRANPSNTLQHLEPVMLEHVAAVLGLKDCDEDLVRIRRRRRTENQHDFTDGELDLIIGVSSETEDFEDEDFDSCYIPVSRTESAGAVCKPATGIMTLYLRDDPLLTSDLVASIRMATLKLLRFGMQEDVYVGGNARHVSFIGMRTGESDFDSFRQPGAVQVQDGGDAGNRNPAGTIIGALAGFVLFVIIIAFFVDRQKREEPIVRQDFAEAIAASGESKERMEDPPVERPNQPSQGVLSSSKPASYVVTGAGFNQNISTLSFS